MNSTMIRLNSVDEVREFVSAAEKCTFDIDVKYNRIIVDDIDCSAGITVDILNSIIAEYSGTPGFLLPRRSRHSGRDRL